MKDDVTRRAAVSGIVGVSVGPWLPEAEARAMGIALSTNEAENRLLTNQIFVDVPLFKAESAVKVGVIFTVVSTSGGLADIRQRTIGGSILLYQTITKAGLAAPSGSANSGFINNVAGSVGRTLEDKMRDVVSATDLGATGDGKTDNATAFLKIKAAAEAGVPVRFVRGVYCSSVGLLFQSPVRILADPGTRIKILAKSDFVVRFDYDYDVSFFDHTGYCENLTLDGNGFAIDGLSLIGVISARFDNIYSTNVHRAGLHMHWAQLCIFNNYTCSGNIEAFSLKPLYGILADEKSSAANTFVNATIEGTAGDGILGKGLVNTVFINGTSQGCGGAGMRLGETPAGALSCTGNTILGMDLEVNADSDITLEASASANDFIGLKSGFATPAPAIRVNKGASRNLFHGGIVGHIFVATGAIDTTIDHVSLLGGGHGLTNYGIRTKWTRLRNISDNAIIIDSVNATQSEFYLANEETYSANAHLDQHHFLYAAGPELSVANPVNPQAGQELRITIFNTGSSALKVRWGTAFRTDGIVEPSKDKNRTYSFIYNSNFERWYLVSMSPADVAN